jgi:hypothetical protein
MHSFTGPSGNHYFHNGDFSGGVKVEASAIADSQLGTMAEIPFEDIRALYLRYLRSERISRLEQAEDAELEAELLGTPQKPAQAPATPSVADWGVFKDKVTEERRVIRHYTRFILRETQAYQFPHPGKIYVHCEQPWVLARVDELPVDGSVLFAVWNPVQGYGWQSGAGLRTQDEFRQMYSLQYTGRAPETIPQP